MTFHSSTKYLLKNYKRKDLVTMQPMKSQNQYDDVITKHTNNTPTPVLLLTLEVNGYILGKKRLNLR
jgi:hypothetical protein